MKKQTPSIPGNPTHLRSWNMSRIRSEDTRPELVVRRILFAMGYRYRIHAKDLPGRPDIVFRSRKKAIFVHGCFWHQHTGCPRATLPLTNQEYWLPKLKKNQARDTEVTMKMKAMGWRVLTIWECDTKNVMDIQNQLCEFLESINSKTDH